MAPLILHNVPDDECYIGDDGVKRPYAMIFNQNDAAHGSGSARSRRNVAETGSFGKSTRRSRSRTGTPARGARENPTLAAADKLFGDWVTNQATSAPSSARKATTGSQQQQQQQQQSQQQSQQGEEPAPQRVVKSAPVELILRGYRSPTQQYAAIAHYEDVAGPILEDYPREPPAAQRRYQSELRDPAFTRRRVLGAEERALVNRADGGEHWVKVTFESAEAADAALFASPQRILGHLVYAEAYRGIAPAKDEACPDLDQLMEGDLPRSKSMPAGLGTPKRRGTGGLPTSFSSRLLDLSPPPSGQSSQTLETGTLSPSQTSTATFTEPIQQRTTGMEPMEIKEGSDAVFCRRIPTARKARLLPAEQALLPQQSLSQRVVGYVPFLKLFGGNIIGNEVPRTETGEFDWNKASLYWKVMWWLDATFGLFKGDLCTVEKDD